MRLWRLTRQPFQDMDGEGARLYGGRWSSEGVAVVYTSPTLSLCALELLVHIDPEDIPGDLVAIRLECEGSPPEERIPAGDLPPDWNRIPDHPACRALGDDWVERGESALVRVPSAVIPEEKNVLLNPRHPDAARFRVASTRPFTFDARLVR